LKVRNLEENTKKLSPNIDSVDDSKKGRRSSCAGREGKIEIYNPNRNRTP